LGIFGLVLIFGFDTQRKEDMLMIHAAADSSFNYAEHSSTSCCLKSKYLLFADMAFLTSTY